MLYVLSFTFVVSFDTLWSSFSQLTLSNDAVLRVFMTSKH